MSITEVHGRTIEAPAAAVKESGSLTSLGRIFRLKNLGRATLVALVIGAGAYGVNEIKRSIQAGRDQRDADALIQRREAQAAATNMPKPPLQLSELEGKNIMLLLKEDIQIGDSIIQLHEADDGSGEIHFSVRPKPSADQSMPDICESFTCRLHPDEKHKLKKGMAIHLVKAADGTFELKADLSVLGVMHVPVAGIENGLKIVMQDGKDREKLPDKKAHDADFACVLSVPYRHKYLHQKNLRDYTSSFCVIVQQPKRIKPLDAALASAR